MGIVKYWKNHIGIIFLIIMLLVLQAYSDLALPSYTADIVDTGITNSGIEYVAPIKMSSETYENIKIFLNDDDTQKLDTYYKKDGKVYKLKSDDAGTMKAAEKILEYPAIIVMQAGMTAKGEDVSKLDQLKQAVNSGMLSKKDILKIVEASKKKISEYGDSIAKSQGIAFVKSQYKELGVNTDSIQKSYLIHEGLLMIAFAVLSMAAAIMVGLLASIVAAQIGRDLRNQVFKRVISFSSAEIDRFQTSSLITRSTNDIQQIQMVTVLFLRIVLYAPILAIGGITKVLKTNTGLNWIIVLAVVVLISLVMMLVGIAMPKFKIMQSLIDKLNLISREILTGVLVIRAFGREKEEEKRFEAANKDLTGTQLFTNRVMTFMMPIMMLVMNGVSVLIVWFGAKNIDKGKMQIGDMMAFITYTMQIIMAFLMLTVLSIMLPRASVSSKRINEVLDTASSIMDPDDAEENDKNYSNVEGVVEFNNVCFAYPGASDDAISDISFTAKPGTTTAIIGSTGSGKSTIMHLITRFYDVTKGKITVDGRDVRSISQNKLREMLGFVPQKAVLFSGDIESNIKFGGDNITDDDMYMAADISQSNEFIMSKSEEFKAPIAQGGTNVSGGQKQRLSIARAIAKRPQVFLFDDSFSALDYKTDKTLRKALNDKLGNSTIIIVAQRISTILHADNIIVLDEGKIAGMGTHEELLNSCETYKEIAKSQLSASELGGVK